MDFRPRTAVWCCLVAAGLAGGCELRKVDIPDPTGPSSAVATSPVVVGAPAAPTPTPNPSPAPSPNPTPNPPPTSTPNPPPTTSCSLPPGTGDGSDCQRTNAIFGNDVEAAIDAVVRNDPSNFDMQDAKCGNCYRVRDTERFTSRLVPAVEARGLCAVFDGEELAVKNSNDFNEQYDVLTASLYLRRGDGSYRATCRPSVF